MCPLVTLRPLRAQVSHIHANNNTRNTNNECRVCVCVLVLRQSERSAPSGSRRSTDGAERDDVLGKSLTSYVCMCVCASGVGNPRGAAGEMGVAAALRVTAASGARNALKSRSIRRNKSFFFYASNRAILQGGDRMQRITTATFERRKMNCIN